LCSILILFSLPYMKNKYFHMQEKFFSWTTQKKFFFKDELSEDFKDFLFFDYEIFAFWFFFVTCFLLGFIGSQPIESPYLICGRILTLFYFIYFGLIFFLNKTLYKN
jgi:hypothetical protein